MLGDQVVWRWIIDARHESVCCLNGNLQMRECSDSMVMRASIVMEGKQRDSYIQCLLLLHIPFSSCFSKQARHSSVNVIEDSHEKFPCLAPIRMYVVIDKRQLSRQLLDRLIKLLTLSFHILKDRQNRWYFNFGQKCRRGIIMLFYMYNNSISDVHCCMMSCQYASSRGRSTRCINTILQDNVQ